MIEFFKNIFLPKGRLRQILDTDGIPSLLGLFEITKEELAHCVQSYQNMPSTVRLTEQIKDETALRDSYLPNQKRIMIGSAGACFLLGLPVSFREFILDSDPRFALSLHAATGLLALFFFFGLALPYLKGVASNLKIDMLQREAVQSQKIYLVTFLSRLSREKAL